MTPEFQAWVERAKSRTLESVLAERGHTLKGRGDKLAGPCPNCGGDDRFAVHLGKQVFHCRGCNGSGGGAISLIRFIDGVDFLRAVESLTGEPPPKDKGERSPRARKSGKLGTLDKTHDYTDEGGVLLFQVLRYRNPKGFRQRRPHPERDGEWINNLDDVRLVLYRLPDLVEAVAYGHTVFVVEGEKDVETAQERLGIAATCNPMGAGKWKLKGANYAQYFHDADVVIIPDNDADPKKGRAHANIVAKDLHDVAASVRVLTLPDGYKDLTEWVEAVGTREEFDRLVEAAPEYMNGYDPSAQQADASVPPPQGEQQTPPPAFYTKQEFLGGFRPPDYLIDGLMQRRFVYSLTGPTGHAKTAIALLMAQLVASNDRNAMFGNRKVEVGRVVYFVGENPDDIRMRVIGADHMRSDNPMGDVIVFVPGVFNIADMQAYLAHQIARHLGGVDFVVVDTSAAYFLGDNEIDNTQIGNHARMLRRLTELPGGPCVLVLCHPIKHAQEQSQLVPRGGGAFLAEVDGNLTVWRKTETVIELYYTGKLRGPGFEPMHFELETIRNVPSLVDAKGRPIPTVRAIAATREKEEHEIGTQEDDENRVLVALLGNPDLSFREVASTNGWVNERSEPIHSRVQRAVERIVRDAHPPLLRKNRNKYELTEKGKEVARAASLRTLRAKLDADDAEKQAAFDLRSPSARN